MTPCSFVAVSIHLAMSGEPSLLTTPDELGRVGDFLVEILVGDGQIRLGQRLLAASRCEISTSSTSWPYRSKHSSASSE